jgi:hypothetical protein
MSVENGAGRPTEEGLYAVEIYFGWKLLEWYAGDWWHEAKVGRWMAGNPAQWVGPLPPRMKDRELVEFDL